MYIYMNETEMAMLTINKSERKWKARAKTNTSFLQAYQIHAKSPSSIVQMG